MMPRIAVLTVGDELLNGEIADTNTARIAAVLGRHGFRLSASLTVGDLEEEIAQALRDLALRHDVVIVSGGLGPTRDDLTARSAASAFERPLSLSAEAMESIRNFFERLGREMHRRDEKQALLPAGAAVLPNRGGTAPGFLLPVNGSSVYFLPGVPEEMAAMLEEGVLPLLKESFDEIPPLRERVFRVFGLPEPKVEELLDGIVLSQGINVAYGLDFPFVLAKLRAEGEGADLLLDEAEPSVRQALGDHLVSVGDETLAERVGRLLVERGMSLALAESCTGGLIAKMLTDVPGSSAFLERSAVTYANSAKIDWLGLSPEILEREGAVSESCAVAMACGIRRVAAADFGVAVTGIAGPTGGTAEKPVGTVYIALAAERGATARLFTFRGDRRRVRTLSAISALNWLRLVLENGFDVKGGR